MAGSRARCACPKDTSRLARPMPRQRYVRYVRRRATARWRSWTISAPCSASSPRNGEWVRRTEHYYLMRLVRPERGQPQFDSPDAEEARFVPLWASGLVEAQAMLTFPSEQRFIGRALARQAI